jgi:MFS family permease
VSTVLGDRVRFGRALHSQPFALLWAGQTISALGDGAFTVALAWSILLLTGSATALAEVLIAQSVPRLIFLLVGGVVADRLPRRGILFWSDGARAVAVLLIAFLYWQHLIAFWQILGLSILFGIADAFFRPAYQAIPPQLVPADDLASANALNSLSQEASTLIGPALGALLVALTGPAAAFMLDSLTFVISAGCLLAMRLPKTGALAAGSGAASPAGEGLPPPAIADQEEAKETPRQVGAVLKVLAEIREGFTYLMSSSWLWVTTLLASVANVGLATLAVSLPKLVHTVYGEGVWLLGALFSASALGSIAASLIIGQLHRLRHRGIFAYLGLILAFISLFVLGIPVPHMLVIAVSLTACSLIGFGLGAFSVIYYTTLQQLVPEDKLGRVSSIDWIGSLAFEPIGLAVIGILTDRWGPSLVFLVAGVVNVTTALIGLSVRGIRELD